MVTGYAPGESYRPYARSRYVQRDSEHIRDTPIGGTRPVASVVSRHPPSANCNSVAVGESDTRRPRASRHTWPCTRRQRQTSDTAHASSTTVDMNRAPRTEGGRAAGTARGGAAHLTVRANHAYRTRRAMPSLEHLREHRRSRASTPERCRRVQTRRHITDDTGTEKSSATPATTKYESAQRHTQGTRSTHNTPTATNCERTREGPWPCWVVHSLSSRWAHDSFTPRTFCSRCSTRGFQKLCHFGTACARVYDGFAEAVSTSAMSTLTPDRL